MRLEVVSCPAAIRKNKFGTISSASKSPLSLASINSSAMLEGGVEALPSPLPLPPPPPPLAARVSLTDESKVSERAAKACVFLMK
jgi:hypothetical protein